ncbi:antichymotrypsin-2-like [Leptidea sinapis]|uniref:antichymotrypsin-2-like n=1 Tax=Leptidea sinapis TaxID=189913 RepID=UPI0021C2FC02|nr:antichymotrypsin-2-like [Leptidea sinapis]
MLNLKSDIIDNLHQQHVNVSIPKIDTTTTTDLKEILRKNGVTDIFNTNSTGLSGILQYPEYLYVSTAIQKAKIIVNELGSEAAAANAAVISTRSAMIVSRISKFEANHPFLYYIMFQGTPIFAGLYTG